MSTPPNFPLGGLAVIEGVMIRSPNHVAVAVRRERGDIVVREEWRESVLKRHRWMNFPLVRGILALFEMFSISWWALNFSANAAMSEGETVDNSQLTVDGGTESRQPTAANRQPSQWVVTLTSVFSFVLALTFIILLPTWLAGAGKGVVENTVGLNLIEGGIRLAIILGYIKAISFMSYVRRLFQYHGAEHKVVNAIERGRELLPEQTHDLSRLHPRCGTNFVVLLVVVKVLLFSLTGWGALWQRVLFRLLLLPVVAGVSFEILRLGARPGLRWLVYPALLPGLWVQRHLTTREPADDQVEVAIHAAEAVLRREQTGERETIERVITPPPRLRVITPAERAAS